MSNPLHSELAGVVAGLLAQTGASESPLLSKDKLREDLTQFRQETVDTAAWATRLVTEWGLRLLGVLVVLIGAWMVAAWARRALYRALNRPRFDQTLVRFLSNTARWAILLVGFVACLTIFGIAPASLAAIVGAAGLAIGLALQGSLTNLAAGIMLLLLRPFNVGDTVIIAGHTGVVDDIEIFNTKLDTGDYRRVIVPNNQIFGAVIENLTHHPRRCVQVTVVVDHTADVDRTRGVLMRAAGSVPGRLEEPAPAVVLQNLAPAGVEWQVNLWARTSEFGTVRQALIERVKAALAEAKIGIPVPKMEILNRGA